VTEDIKAEIAGELYTARLCSAAAPALSEETTVRERVAK
jgi:hypothetical protein